MRLSISLEEFASGRRKVQEDTAAYLAPHVRTGQWTNTLEQAVETAFHNLYTEESGQRFLRSGLEDLVADLRKAYLAGEDTDPGVLTLMLATAVINAATVFAAEDDDEELFMEWVSMEDGKVRAEHAFTDGQVRPLGEPFDVDGYQMPYPGYPGVPVDLWINCRCMVRPRPAAEFALGLDRVSKAEVDSASSPVMRGFLRSLRTQQLAAEPLEEPTHAGVAVVSRATNRVLMLQRKMDPTDAPDVQGTWEFPGGSREEMDETIEATAWREFSEETGLPKPEGEMVNGWRSPDGVYQGFVYAVPSEEEAFEELNPDPDAAVVVDPDNPHRRHPDVTAWFTLEQVKNLGPALRPEVAKMDWSVLTLTEEDEMPENESLTAAAGGGEPIPWHGVLAVEGIWTGDKRKFKEGSLTNRPLPLSLKWQKVGAPGHDGDVVTARMDGIKVVNGEQRAWGEILETVPESDEMIGLMAEFGRLGVSVDADMATFELSEDEEGVEFSSARTSGATALPIPAFAEAWVTFGPPPPEWLEDEKPDRRKDDPDDMEGEGIVDPPYPEDVDEALKTMQSRIPSGQVAAAAVAARYADTAMGRAELETHPEQFVDVAPGKTEDGPGWITHPVETDRLRDWVTKGPGGAKIGWGTPGDFNRCRAMMAEYVKPQHLSGYCANRHYDALGFWPGPKAHSLTETEALAMASDEVLADVEENGLESMSLVASVVHTAPAAWFKNPEFSEGDPRLVELRDNDGEPTGRFACPLTITDEGEVFGHLAPWDVCHLNSVLSGTCVTAPHSASDYAYFLNSGVVRTDEGDVPVGQITLGSGHAGDGLSMRAALAHYDNCSTAVCDINVGDDAFGIWFHGWVRPGATKEQVTSVLASGVSGDWRDAGGNLELIAALSVNTPGFGIPRPRATVKAGRQVSLVAAGGIPPSTASAEQAEKNMAEMGLDSGQLSECVIQQIANEVVATLSRRDQMRALAASVGEVE